MTNTRNAQIATTIIDDDENDTLDAFDALKTDESLTDDDRIEIAQMLEICPIHSCDINICIDDAYAAIHFTPLMHDKLTELARLAPCAQYRS